MMFTLSSIISNSTAPNLHQYRPNETHFTSPGITPIFRAVRVYVIQRITADRTSRLTRTQNEMCQKLNLKRNFINR